MAGKDHILKWSTAAASNTDIANIGIQGTNLVSNFDGAEREMMAEIAGVVTRQVDKAAGSYTPALTDHNQFWRCTGAVTLTLTAAATLTTGWCLWVRANGGAVTIDPSGAELIDGAATLVLADGQTALIICTGTAFSTVMQGNAGFGAAFPLKQDGRLTLTTAVPVTVSDVTAAATLYYTPYLGNVISLYTGTGWINRVFSEISFSLTGILTNGRPHDIFIWDSAGTAAFDRLAWNNDTTRAVALARQDGVLVQTSDHTRRYVGTIYATSTGTTEDSLAKRFLWNMYNRVRRPMSVYDATNSWNYTTATIRQANAAATNQIDFVRGLDEDCAEASIAVSLSNSLANVIVTAGIGQDATNAFAADSDMAYQAVAVVGTVQQLRATYRGNPGIGRHFLAWLEYSTASGTTTWYGDNNVPTIARSGIQGSVLA